MLSAALQYEKLKWSVIPLRPREKLPLFPWSEFQKRRATRSEILEWWKKYPDANVGIVTGSVSGLGVLDLDGPSGLRYGSTAKLTSPVTILTGKGRQLYYKFTEGLCNSAGDIAEGVDVRGEGGYVVAPPSIHPNGKRYQALCGVPYAVTLSDFPKLTSVKVPSIAAKYGQPTSSWVADALANLKDGNRDNTFTRVIGKLHGSGFDSSAIRALLWPYAVDCAYTAPNEFDKCLRSVCRYETGTSVHEVQGSSDIGTFLQDSRPVDWLCKGIIARGSVGFVAGLPETMKTWLLMDLALELARGGGNWLGMFPVTSGKALFIDQERHKSETQRRFKKIMAAKGLTVQALSDSLFVRSGTSTRLNIDESFRAFRQELLELKPDIVIIDSFTTFHTENENDRQSIQKVLERVKQLRNEVGCSIVFIDHETKSVFTDKENTEAPSAFRMAGSVAKPAAAEFVLTVRRYSPTESTVYHTKSTLGPTVECFNATVQDVPDGITVTGKR